MSSFNGKKRNVYFFTRRYAVFFGLLCVCIMFWFNALNSILRYTLVWPFAASVLLLISYATNNPYLIIGKRRDGNFSIILLLLNLPWLLINWSVWFLTAKFVSEINISKINGTDIYISRKPFFGELKEKFDVIIDLTAEFPGSSYLNQNYFYLPWLDGVAPSVFSLPPDISADSKILVHCAQGHGRSTAYTSILLKELGFCKSAIEAYGLIKQSRPRAELSKDQLRFIEHF